MQTDTQKPAIAAPADSAVAVSADPLDILWLCPWPNGGAGSASRGALGYLASRGLRTSYNPAHKPAAPPRCIVLLGLNVTIADRMRAQYPKAHIVLQNHSPWLFLAWSQQDAGRWHQALAWARSDGNAQLAQVAGAEYASARAAYGRRAIGFLPAVYPYAVADTAMAPTAPPAIVLAHRDRPWKSIATQVVATAIANGRSPCRLIYPPPPDQVTPVADIAEVWGLPVHVGKWRSQAAFRNDIRTATVALCATWAECYSQTALDALSQGVPAIAGPANWFVPECWQVFPDDPSQIAARIGLIIADPAKARATALEAAAAAQATQLAALQEWQCRYLPVS